MVGFMIIKLSFSSRTAGISRPARETLFTVLERQDKYKAKSFLDTFGYRSGDALGVHLDFIASSLCLGMFSLTLSALGIITIWLAVSLALGQAQSQMSKRNKNRST